MSEVKPTPVSWTDVSQSRRAVAGSRARRGRSCHCGRAAPVACSGRRDILSAAEFRGRRRIKRGQAAFVGGLAEQALDAGHGQFAEPESPAPLIPPGTQQASSHDPGVGGDAYERDPGGPGPPVKFQREHQVGQLGPGVDGDEPVAALAVHVGEVDPALARDAAGQGDDPGAGPGQQGG